MPMLTNRVLATCKLEGVEGVDEIGDPVNGGSNTHLIVSDANFALNPDEIERNVQQPTLSPLGVVIGMRDGTATFSTELRGRGSVPTSAAPLRDDPLWRACGYSPTYSAGSATYYPNTAQCVATTAASATIYLWLDGMLCIITGARGNVEIVASTGNAGRLNWTMRGQIAQIPFGSATTGAIQARTMPIASYDNFSLRPPTVVSASFTFAGAGLTGIQQINMNSNNELIRREDMTAPSGIRGYLITKRNPGGTFNPELVARDSGASATDFFGRWNDAKTSAIQVVIGSAVGNKVIMGGPNAQLKNPRFADRNGIRSLDIDYVYTGSNDDEVGIAFL